MSHINLPKWENESGPDFKISLSQFIDRKNKAVLRDFTDNELYYRSKVRHRGRFYHKVRPKCIKLSHCDQFREEMYQSKWKYFKRLADELKERLRSERLNSGA